MDGIERLRSQIRASDHTYDEIAVGAAVGRSWLDKFMQGRIAEPGVGKIERLRNFLDAKSRPSASQAA